MFCTLIFSLQIFELLYICGTFCSCFNSDEALMSILKYFKRKGVEAALPDPKGPLSNKVPSISIAEANKEVLKNLNENQTKKSPCIKVTPEQKAQIARYAMEHGNCAASRKYSKELQQHLNESTVCSWVKTYRAEWQRKRKLGEVNPEVKILSLAKRGCPLLLGETLDNHVKAYVRSVYGSGGPVTSTITIAVGRVIVRKYDSKLLIENGGPLSLTTNWAKSLLYHTNFVKRKGCSTTKQMIHDFENIKINFLNDVFAIVKMEDIPDELILNWDHTPIIIVSGSSWTMAHKGAK